MMIFVIVITTYMYVQQDLTISNTIIHYTVQHHMLILVILVITSVAFGFVWANLSSSMLERKSKESQNLLDVVLMFLGQEERAIMDHLVKKESETTQSEISRLPNMNRVKAHRSLQKLHEKNIIHIIPHGKIRKIQLKESIYSILKKDS